MLSVANVRTAGGAIAPVVLRTLDQADVRKRAMQRALRQAETLPEPQAQHMLNLHEKTEFSESNKTQDAD